MREKKKVAIEQRGKKEKHLWSIVREGSNTSFFVVVLSSTDLYFVQSDWSIYILLQDPLGTWSSENKNQENYEKNLEENCFYTVR